MWNPGKSRFISITECIKGRAAHVYPIFATQTPLFLLCGQVYHYYSKTEQSNKKWQISQATYHSQAKYVGGSRRRQDCRRWKDKQIVLPEK